MELMCVKDKATKLCHVLHTGSLLVVPLLETQDRQTHRIKRLI